MYIFEIITKLILKRNRKPLLEKNELEADYICEHIFLPIDSTADYLACNKCGFVVKNELQAKHNPFKYDL